MCGPAGRSDEDRLQNLKSQIACIGAAIKTAEDNANADTKDRDYWRKKERHLREEKRQLREEKLLMLRSFPGMDRCPTAAL
eukprot:175503-Rhodomonas_salina.1